MKKRGTIFSSTPSQLGTVGLSSSPSLTAALWSTEVADGGP